MKPYVLVIACMTLAAGCLADGGTSDDGRTSRPVETEPGGMGRYNETFSGTGSIAVGAFDVGLLVSQNGMPVDVGRNATAIHATLEWTSADGLSDLNLVLESPTACDPGANNAVPQCVVPRMMGQPPAGWFENTNGSFAAPDSPSTLALDRAQIEDHQCLATPCSWSLRVLPNDVAGVVTFNFQAVVEYDHGQGSAQAASA